jgi:hypothetical protein
LTSITCRKCMTVIWTRPVDAPVGAPTGANPVDGPTPPRRGRSVPVNEPPTTTDDNVTARKVVWGEDEMERARRLLDW